MDTDLTTLNDQQLAQLIASATLEQERRTAAMSPPVAITIRLDAGNERAGARGWIKHIKGIVPSKGNGFGLIGDFVDAGQHAAKEGDFFVACGSGGSWKNSTKHYFLLRVKSGATVSEERGYQKINASNCELIAQDTKWSDDEVTAALTKYPDLAPTVATKWLPIYFALKVAAGANKQEITVPAP
jgi:hypothetical protein